MEVLMSNPAAMMTKAVNEEKLDKYMSMTKQKVEEGRARKASQVKEGKDNYVEAKAR